MKEFENNDKCIDIIILAMYTYFVILLCSDHIDVLLINTCIARGIFRAMRTIA